MEDGGDVPVLPEDAPHGVRVQEIADDEATAGDDELPPSGRKVVEDDGLEAAARGGL